MRRNHKNIVIALAALTAGVVASAVLPAGVAQAATVSAVPAAKTAPGMPKFGEAGPMVKALQEAIIKNGFTLRGGATGTFDKRTLATLKTFQKVVGLPVTGVVDVATAKVLKLTTAATTTTAAPATTAAPTTTAAPATTVAAPVYAFTESNLPVRGNKGDNVVILQKALVAAGFAVKGGVDGAFGSGTTATIAAFQTAKGLTATGLLDAATARALGLVAPAAAAAPAPVAAAAVTAPLTLDTLPSRGQKSESVVALQKALVAAGIQVKGGVDGVFGIATTVALRKYQSANGLNVTGVADAATAVKLGLISPPAVTISVFPVQGQCNFVDTWHAPRGGGRLHLGVDIIAPEGKLIYAAVDGTITKIYTEGVDKLAGNGFRLTAADGTYFFYGHLRNLADGITVGTKVKAGQVLGFNGHTGDTNTPHLHFEVHPRGGEAVNPFFIVKSIDACNVTEPRPAA